MKSCEISQPLQAQREPSKKGKTYSLTEVKVQDMIESLKQDAHESKIRRLDEKIHAIELRKYDLNRAYQGRSRRPAFSSLTMEDLGAIGVRVEDHSIVYVLPDNKIVRRWKGDYQNTPIIEEDD